MENPIAMYTKDALRIDLYDDWDDPLTNANDGALMGSRDAPIDLEEEEEEDSRGIKLEDLWKQQCPEYPSPEELAPPPPPPPPEPQLLMPISSTTAPAPKPPPDAFERYLKLKMKKLDRKRRQAEEEAQRHARERRDVIDSIDSIADANEESARLAVELAAWDTRVAQMGAALLAAKAGRKATRLKVDLREYRKKRDAQTAKDELERQFQLAEQIPDSFFVNLLN